jgi:hypothetical protein
MGGTARAGLLVQPADLGRVRDGGIEANLDFRQVYSDVLRNWLGVDPAGILGEPFTPFFIVKV